VKNQHPPAESIERAVRRFAERQSVAAISHHPAGDGHRNAGGISLDGDRVIFTWKSYRFFLHILFHSSGEFSAVGGE